MGNVQIEDLQLSLGRMEKEHGRREDILRQEIADLQKVFICITHACTHTHTCTHTHCHIKQNYWSS